MPNTITWIRITDTTSLPKDESLVYTQNKMFYLAFYNFGAKCWEDSTEFNAIRCVTHYAEVVEPCNG